MISEVVVLVSSRSGESPPQVLECKDLRVLLMTERRIEREVDRWIRAASAALMRDLGAEVMC